MPLIGWTIKDYEKQWAEGIERIKHENQSCLIATMQDIKDQPFISWWILYKEGNKIFVQNQILLSQLYKEVVGNKPFNEKTCYQFISPRRTITEDGEKISEWFIDFNCENE